MADYGDGMTVPAMYTIRMCKAEQADSKLDGFLNRLKLSSGIDTDTQTLKIFCAENNRNQTKQLMEEELKNIEEELHPFVEIVSETEEFSIERHNSKSSVGSKFFYKEDGKQFGVTVGCLVENTRDGKKFALTTCHQDVVENKDFYFKSDTEDVVVGKCVASARSRKPFLEGDLVELNERGLELLCSCFGNYNPETPLVASGPYSGNTGSLPSSDVITCMEPSKRGKIKYTHRRVPDPKDGNRMLSGCIVTVPIGNHNLCIEGHSGVLFALALGYDRTVRDWCQSDTTTQNRLPVNQTPDDSPPLLGVIPNAIPIDDPSVVILPTEVTSQEPPVLNLTTQVEVQESPIPITSDQNIVMATGNDMGGASGNDVGDIPGNDIGGATGNDIGDASGTDMSGEVGSATGNDNGGATGNYVGGVTGNDNGGATGNDMGGAARNDMGGATRNDMGGATRNDIGDATGNDIGSATGASANVTGGAIGGTSSTSGNKCKCSCVLADRVMAHEVLTMHCYGINRGECKGGSISCRVDSVLRAFEEQIEDMELKILPYLYCPPQ